MTNPELFVMAETGVSVLTGVVLLGVARTLERVEKVNQRILEKLRVDNQELVRKTWQEAQRVLLAEAQGDLRHLKDYMKEVDRAHEFGIPERRGGGDAPRREPEDHTKLGR